MKNRRKTSPFSGSEHRPIDCNTFTNETRTSAEALHTCESPFPPPNPETVPKHAPNTAFNRPEKSAGENNHPRHRTANIPHAYKLEKSQRSQHPGPWSRLSKL